MVHLELLWQRAMGIKTGGYLRVGDIMNMKGQLGHDHYW